MPQTTPSDKTWATQYKHSRVKLQEIMTQIARTTESNHTIRLFKPL